MSNVVSLSSFLSLYSITVMQRLAASCTSLLRATLGVAAVMNAADCKDSIGFWV